MMFLMRTFLVNVPYREKCDGESAIENHSGNHPSNPSRCRRPCENCCELQHPTSRGTYRFRYIFIMLLHLILPYHVCSTSVIITTREKNCMYLRLFSVFVDSLFSISLPALLSVSSSFTAALEYIFHSIVLIMIIS